MKPLFNLFNPLHLQILKYFRSVKTASIVLPLAAGLLLSGLAAAREKPLVEIGTSMGVTVHSHDEQSVTYVGIPGLGIWGQPMIYASFFAGEPIVFEPQLALSVVSNNSNTYTVMGLAGQVAYFFKCSDASSPFLSVIIGLRSVSGDGSSESETAVGGKIGYRFPLGTSMGLRIEAGYSRWSEYELNVFTFGIGIGAVARRRQ